MTNKDFFKRVGCLFVAVVMFYIGIPILFGLLLAFCTG